MRAEKTPVSCETASSFYVERLATQVDVPRRGKFATWGAAIVLHLVLFSPWGMKTAPLPKGDTPEPMAVRLYTPPSAAEPSSQPIQPTKEAITPAPTPVAEQSSPNPIQKSRPAPRKATSAPAHKTSTPASHANATSKTASSQAPSASEMLEGSLSDMSKRGWTQTSERFAEDTAPNVQSALERYRRDWVQRAQRYADMHFPRTDFEGQLLLAVTVTRDGQLARLDVIHSSGNAALDAQALKTIRAAAPFRLFDEAMGNRRSVSFQQRWVFNRGALFELQ